MFGAYKRFFRFAGEQKGTWYMVIALRSRSKRERPSLINEGRSPLPC